MFTDQPKKVVFLSYLGHQRRFFSFLAAHLPPGVAAVAISFRPLSSPGRLLMALIAQTLGSPGDNAPAIGKIVAFSHLKFSVNHSGWPQWLLTTVKVIQQARAAAYYGYLKDFLAKRKCDLVVVWNGAPLPAAVAVAAARACGVRLLFCENGYLPYTVVMDPMGVNAYNSLMGKPAEFYRRVAVEPEKLTTLFRTPPLARPLNTKQAEKTAARLKETIVLPEEFVFLPLQVHDDSQILIHSPRFKDMPSVVEFCVAGIMAFNDKHGARLGLVVKEHPSDYGQADYSGLRLKYPDVIFTKTMDTKELIGTSSAVVTVNSTVGVESLLYLKPIVTLGDAFYNVPGLIRHCGAGERLEDILPELIGKPIDRKLAEQFLYFLRYEYLVPVDRRNPAKSDPGPAVRRLVETMQ